MSFDGVPVISDTRQVNSICDTLFSFFNLNNHTTRTVVKSVCGSRHPLSICSSVHGELAILSSQISMEATDSNTNWASVALLVALYFLSSRVNAFPWIKSCIKYM